MADYLTRVAAAGSRGAAEFVPSRPGPPVLPRAAEPAAAPPAAADAFPLDPLPSTGPLAAPFSSTAEIQPAARLDHGLPPSTAVEPAPGPGVVPASEPGPARRDRPIIDRDDVAPTAAEPARPAAPVSGRAPRAAEPPERVHPEPLPPPRPTPRSVAPPGGTVPARVRIPGLLRPKLGGREPFDRPAAPAAVGRPSSLASAPPSPTTCEAADPFAVVQDDPPESPDRDSPGPVVVDEARPGAAPASRFPSGVVTKPAPVAPAPAGVGPASPPAVSPAPRTEGERAVERLGPRPRPEVPARPAVRAGPSGSLVPGAPSPLPAPPGDRTDSPTPRPSNAGRARPGPARLTIGRIEIDVHVPPAAPPAAPRPAPPASAGEVSEHRSFDRFRLRV
jgi:hypothetical protein